jgi:tetratricopeptide (TPR) repeat protein
MKRLYWTPLTLWLLLLPAFGQVNPHQALQDALVLENRGNFVSAAEVAKGAIDSGELRGNELGRGYIILAVSCQGAGDMRNAQAAFERSLQVLEHARQHPEDYASALENYAGFYIELGQLDVAAPMWQKALHLRQSIGDHPGSTLSLIHLAELALTRNQVREGHQYLQEASDEAKIATDLLDEDRALFLETQGWLAILEHHARAAVPDYQQALELLEHSRGGQHWLIGWEHMLLGRAYGETGDFGRALANMENGLTILDHALGRKNPKYFAAELAYSRVLDQVGLHSKAGQMRTAAEKATKDYYRGQCIGCTINVAAFR